MNELIMTETLKDYITYELIISECKAPGLEGISVYGVRIVRDDFGAYAQIEDISSDINEVEQLLEKLRTLCVTPDQLSYIAEDYVAELSMC